MTIVNELAVSKSPMGLVTDTEVKESFSASPRAELSAVVVKATKFDVPALTIPEVITSEASPEGPPRDTGVAAYTVLFGTFILSALLAGNAIEPC